jgi:hypothetical protein
MELSLNMHAIMSSLYGIATNLTNDMVGMNFKCVDHDDAIVSLLCAIIMHNRVRDGE